MPRSRPAVQEPIINSLQQTLLPSQIKIVPGVQSRLALVHTEVVVDGAKVRVPIDPALVDKLISSIEAGANVDPIDVVKIKNSYTLARGNTRYAAHVAKNGNEPMPVTIHEGTLRDALWLSIGSNAGHGTQRTNQDLQHEISQVLLNKSLFIEEGEPLAYREIARRIVTSHQSVSAMVERIQAIILWLDSDKHGSLYPDFQPDWLIQLIESNRHNIPDQILPEPITAEEIDERLKAPAVTQEKAPINPIAPMEQVKTHQPPVFAATEGDSEADEDDDHGNTYPFDVEPGDAPAELNGSMIISQLTVICFTCAGGEDVTLRFDQKIEDGQKSAKAQGWIEEDGFWFCPECKEK